MADQKSEPTKAYRFTGGKNGNSRHYGDDNRLIGVGEIVQLRESQAEALKDRFEPVDGGFARGDVAGTNNTPEATAPDGRPGQNPELGQQSAAAALKAVGDKDKATGVKDEQGKAAESDAKK